MLRKTKKRGPKSTKQKAAEEKRDNVQISKMLSAVASTIMHSTTETFAAMEDRLCYIDHATGSVTIRDIQYSFYLAKRIHEHAVKNALEFVGVDYVKE